MVEPKKKTAPRTKSAPTAVKPAAVKLRSAKATVAKSEPEVVTAPEVLMLDEIKSSLFVDEVVAPDQERVSTAEIVIPTSTGETAVVIDDTPEVESEPDVMPSRRGRARGETSSTPEPVSMLTPDRILEPSKKRPAPESGFNRFLFGLTFGLVNLGDPAAVRHRKAVDALIGAKLTGNAKFVPVLTRKGGVGKTTTTTLLGMALARVREDRVIAIDANPDRGTLAERFTRTTDKTVRDVVTKAAAIRSFSDFSDYVSRDKTRLDVLASDTDPFLSEAFDESDYNVVANIVDRYYSVVLTDCGTGIVHSVMKATLDRADGIVIVSGGSFDEARLAAETLTWLESNGYKHLVRGAIVALNTATQGTNLVNVDEIESHFRSRVREIVRIPYDPLLAAGSYIDFDKLRPLTQESARTLAALVVEGLTE